MSRRGAGHPMIPTGRRWLTHGDDQIRTGDPLLAKQVLSQLSYIPKMGSLHLRSSSFGRHIQALAPAAADKNGPLWNRTTDLAVISRALYPSELKAQCQVSGRAAVP
jgi:hypothetical protein